MYITARRASVSDVPDLVYLYGLLEEEMTALSVIWPRASGLAGDPATTFTQLLSSESAEVGVGLIDESVFGFIVALSEPLVVGRDRIATIRYLFTEPPARGVGVAVAMLDHTIKVLEDSGHELFDAHVLPGHRMAKNFFETAGFKARHITMHRK